MFASAPNRSPPTNPSDLLEIVSVGIKASSAYNGQPWRFQLRGDELDIYLIRTKNFFLKLEGISFFEMGTVIENLSEGARSKGLEMQIKKETGALGLDEPCVTVKFLPGQQPPADIRHVLERTTNRKPYRADALAGLEKELHDLLDDPNVRVVVSADNRKSYLADMLAQLEKFRYGNYYLFREAASFIRFNEEESTREGDLLDYRTLELKLSDKFKVKFARHPLVHRLMRWLGLPKRVGLEHRDLLEHSGALITFMIKQRDFRSCIRLGRIIQRTLNFLAKKGYQAMPVLGGLYLFDVLIENEEIFTLEECDAIRYCQDSLRRFFELNGEKPAFIIRTGIGDPPSYRSFRRNLDRFLVKEPSTV